MRRLRNHTSEIVNAYVQEIINLPNPAKIHDFYKTLSHSVQSLQTMGKTERVNGNTRNVLEKLKGIKADLVRGEDGWQDWDLPRLVVALKRWRNINEVANLNSNDDRSMSKQSGRRSTFTMRKTVTESNVLAYIVTNKLIS